MKIRGEVSQWQDFLNTFVGVISFSIAIAIAGLKAKFLWSCLSVVFLMCLVFPQMKKWPPTILALKKKKQRTDRETILYKGLMDEFFCFKAIVLNFSAYWFGVLMLIAVGAGFFDWVDNAFCK